jgi:hypothetical protein
MHNSPQIYRYQVSSRPGGISPAAVSFFQEGGPARVALHAAQQPITLDFGKAAVALLVGSLEPLEGFVRLAPIGVDLGNLVGRFILKLFDELRQRGICFLLFSCGMIGKRKPLSAPARSAGTFAFNRTGATGSLVKIASSISPVVCPPKGRVPVTISYSTTPNEKRSERASSSFPRACSGDM